MTEISIHAPSGERRRAVPAWRRLLSRAHADLRVRWDALGCRQAPQRRPRSRLPELSVKDLEAILATARILGGLYGPTDSALIETAAASKRLREGELLALRWGDIDWAAGTVNVERALRDAEFRLPKCRRARQVRLAPHTRRVLRRHRASLDRREPGNLVFPDPTDGDCLDPDALRRRFRTALRRAGFPVMHPYELWVAFKAPWWSRYR
jgi:integrase